jgi:hypothetical protein
MNYTKKSFSVTAPGSQQYRDNWERTFRPKRKVLRCLYCDQLKFRLEARGALGSCPSSRKFGHEFTETEVDVAEVEPAPQRCDAFFNVMQCRLEKGHADLHVFSYVGSHNRPDGTECPYMAENFCNKCGWVKSVVSAPARK